MQQKSGTIEYSFKGREKITVFETVPRTNWLVCITAFTDDLASDAINQRNTLIICAAVIFIVLLGSIIQLMRKIIISPVQRIMRSKPSSS